MAQVQLTIRIITDKGTGSSSSSSSKSSSSGADGTDQDITEVAILAAHAPSGAEALWSLDDFLERVAYMRELYHEFSATRRPPVFDEDTSDPFFIDPTAAMEIGQARLYLEPLSYLFDITDQVCVCV